MNVGGAKLTVVNREIAIAAKSVFLERQTEASSPEDGRYIYGVTFLDISAGNAPTYHVTISENFESWQVEEVQ